MPLQLRPAREDDAPAMGLVGTRAFQETLGVGLFPPHLRALTTEDEETPWRTSRTLGRIRAGKESWVVVDDLADMVVGYAQWERPHSVSDDDNAAHADTAPEDAVPASLDKERLASLEKALDAEAEKALGPGGHKSMWYLIILCVDPDHQRRGVGAKLLRSGLEQATAEGRQVFLVASPQGKPLYEAFGFKIIGEPYDLVGTLHYSMLWTPAVASA